MGYILLVFGLLIAISVFVLSYEYPTVMDEVLEAIITIGSFVFIIIGAILTYRSQA